MTLPLPTTKTDTCSIGDCLEKYFESETMAGKNKYLCSHCESYQTAVKTFKISDLPENLIIHFNRFKPNGNVIEKNTKDVKFSLDNLSLAQYCSTPLNNTEYSLYAISNHNGELNQGHYTAYCKKDNTW